MECLVPPRHLRLLRGVHRLDQDGDLHAAVCPRAASTQAHLVHAVGRVGGFDEDGAGCR